MQAWLDTGIVGRDAIRESAVWRGLAVDSE